MVLRSSGIYKLNHQSLSEKELLKWFKCANNPRAKF